MKQVYLLLLLVLFSRFVNAQTNPSVDTIVYRAEKLLNSNPAKALELAGKGEQLAKTAGYTYGLNRAIAIKGVAHYKIDQYDKASDIFEQAKKQSSEDKDTINLTYTTYWLGNLQLHQGSYSKALDLYQDALNLATASGNKPNLARAIDGKASIYEALNETGKAKELYTQSLKISTESSFNDWIPTVTFSLANIEYQKGNKASAIEKYNRAIQLSNETGNLNNKANCLQQLASIAYEDNQSKEAMDYIQQAMDIFKQTGSVSSYSYSRLLMSAILLKEQDWDLAAQLAQQSLNEGKAKKETGLQRDAAEILYYAYLGKGNTAKALDFHIQFHQLSEKEHNEELTKKLTQMELQSNFETERELQKAISEKEKSEINAQLDKQKLTQKAALVGFLFIAIIAGLAIFAFLQKRKDTRLVAAEKHKSDLILAALLPNDLFEEVKKVRNSDEQHKLSVFFADLKTDSKELVQAFDVAFTKTLQKHSLRQVKNRDGLYIAVSNNGIAEKHMAQNAIRAGLELIEIIRNINADKAGGKPAEIGVGIHSGLVVADVLGLKTSELNIWGDTVNVAARIEQHGMRGKVNISSETHALVKDDFKCVNYGNLPITNQLELGLYFIELS